MYLLSVELIHSVAVERRVKAYIQFSEAVELMYIIAVEHQANIQTPTLMLFFSFCHCFNTY